MTASRKNAEERVYDVRSVERHLRKGLITESQFLQYQKNLPDATEKMAAITVEQTNEIAARQERREKRRPSRG